MPTDPRPVRWTMYQDGHTCWAIDDRQAVIDISAHHVPTVVGKPDDVYIAIELDGEWAFDTDDEIDAFASALKRCLREAGA